MLSRKIGKFVDENLRDETLLLFSSVRQSAELD